jgi:predicted NBD/HSP70 family sugar kinase
MILAFDIGGSNTRYAVGKPRDYESYQVTDYDSEMSYKSLLSLLQTIIDKENPDKVGFSVPGPIYPPGIVSPSAAPSPNISIDDAPLQQALNDRVEPRVAIQRDLHCAAQGILHLNDSSTFVLLYPGTGFGYATAYNGDVVTGANNTAGELATAQSPHGSYDDVLCLAAMTRHDSDSRPPKQLLENMDEAVYQYIERFAHLTAPLIRTTAPPTVFIGGHLAEYWEDLKQPLVEELQDELPYTPDLRSTEITPLVGAFTLGSGNIHF